VYGYDKDNFIIFMEEIKGQTVRDYIASLGDLRTPENQILMENLGVLVGRAISNLHSQRIMHGDLTTSNMLLPESSFQETLPAAATAAAASELEKHVLESAEKAAIMAAQNESLRASRQASASTQSSSHSSTSSSGEEEKLEEMKSQVHAHLKPMVMPTKVALLDLGLSFQSDLVEDRAVDLYVMERAIQTTHLHSELFLHVIYNTYKNCNVLGNKVMTRLNEVRQRGRKRSMVG